MIIERLGERSSVAALHGTLHRQKSPWNRHPVNRAGQLASPSPFALLTCIWFLGTLEQPPFSGADRIMNSDKPSGGGKFDKIP